VLGCCCAARGWWDTGHMLVAEIAWRHLTSETNGSSVVGAVEQSLKAFQTYSVDSSTFVTSSCWMDDIKRKGITQFGSWHYINLPICEDNITFCDTTTVQDVLQTQDNIVWAIKEALNTIKSKTAGGFERGFALKNLLHLAGDAHQPLHALDRYSNETPNGDAGGNGFRVRNGSINNLHSFWDSGAGLFNNSLKRPLDKVSQQYISDWATRIISKTVETNFTFSTNISEWLLQGFGLAPIVYNLTYDSTPSLEYTLAAQEAIIQQIGTAGYHLALLLKQIVPCNSETNNCPNLDTASEKDDQQMRTDFIVVAVLLGIGLAASIFINVVLGYNIAKKQRIDSLGGLAEDTPLNQKE